MSNGFVDPSNVKKSQIGGRQVTEQLKTLLMQSSSTSDNPLHQQYQLQLLESPQLLSRVKESSCYVALDPVKETKLASDTHCVERVMSLYDHRYRVRLNDERFLAPEILFQPQLFRSMDFDHGSQNSGLHQFLYASIMEGCAQVWFLTHVS